ncbi:MAG TPA: DNA primase [Flavobacteriales bacterium]|jgi:DNA primase|nr:DNA primase [Flavobacteriales bacterium]
MIKQETIEKIFDTARVEEVIGDFVNLKRAGSNLKGYSPFNDEKSPSFMVSPSKQIWKDFSSGKGGNVISFLMEHERMTYPEALRWLAKRYNIEIEETEQTDEERQKQTERESLFLVLEFAKNWFKEQLFDTEIGQSVGLGYFKERGFRQETLKTFETGFSPEAFDALTQAAIKKGFKKDFLIKSGLTIERNGKLIDRFRGRIMFPILSMSGRVLGFGGRILNSSFKTAKYINSPENKVYHKSKILYGIYQAKQSIVKEDQCILVEGYTDVMAFHQAGINNVVASSGTALTVEQIQLIKRLTKNILVIFDGDRAGINAALRGIDMILEQGLNVKVLLLPDGEDPDSFSKKVSTEELILYLANNTQDFINFKAALLQEEAANDPIKKGELIRNIIESIAKIPNSIQQEIYVKEVARIMAISEKVLFKELALVLKGFQSRQEKDVLRQKQRETLKPVEKSKEATVVVNKRDILEREIIKLLLLYGTKTIDIEDWDIKEIPEDNSEPVIEKVIRKSMVAEEIYKQLQEDELEFSNPVFNRLYNLIITKNLEGEAVDLSKLLPELSEEEARMLSDILMADEKYKLANWEERQISVKSKEATLGWHVMDVLLNLRRLLIQELINTQKESFKELDNETQRINIFNEVKDYLFLFRLVSTKLYRLA